MGTRALVRVFDGDEEICCIYRQFDGYPDGLGEEVRAFCAKRRIVNGISSRHHKDAIANGAGCLAALLVCELKGGEVGNVYIHAPGTKNVWEDFEYHVRCPRRTESRGDGLPIVVEGFSVSRGGERERLLEPVTIPGGAEEHEDDR